MKILVKKAFALFDLLEPLITKIFDNEKPTLIAYTLRLFLRSPSSKGVNLLNKGTINDV